MEDNIIRVEVDHNLNVNATTGVGQPTDAKTNPQQVVNPNGESKTVALSISSQFMMEQLSRMVGALGNQELATGISTTSRYAFLGMRAIAGDVTAQVTLALDMSRKALELVRKQADMLNEIDTNMSKQGLINLEGVKVDKHFITGRYTYSRL